MPAGFLIIPEMVKRGRPRITPDQIEVARELYACGYDTAEIARHLIVAEADVYNAVFGFRQ